MASTNINHFKQWQLSTTPGIDGLKFVEDASIGDFGEGEVVVEMHAASLNFMDLFVAKVRQTSRTVGSQLTLPRAAIRV